MNLGLIIEVHHFKKTSRNYFKYFTIVKFSAVFLLELFNTLITSQKPLTASLNLKLDVMTSHKH